MLSNLLQRCFLTFYQEIGLFKWDGIERIRKLVRDVKILATRWKSIGNILRSVVPELFLSAFASPRYLQKAVISIHPMLQIRVSI